LTSYFEIGGHIVEVDLQNLTSLSSSPLTVSVAERPERGRTSARSQASSMPQTSPFRESDRSLFEQWQHTVFMPIREMPSINMRNIPVVIGYGINVHLKAIRSNYDWVMGRLIDEHPN